MTKLLQQAFEKAQQLPQAEQDRLAKSLLEEIESERKWDALFSRRGKKLEQLAEEAGDEHRRNLTEPLDPDTL
jgi:hypothetical protein